MALTFSDFWNSYPKRKGPNPKALARTRWDKAIKNGATPEMIINSAKAYCDEMRENQKLGTEFVCQATTWLNQKRYEDYVVEEEKPRKPQFFVNRLSPEWDIWQKWLKANGHPTGSPCSPRDNGWWFPSPLPPNQTQEV